MREELTHAVVPCPKCGQRLLVLNLTDLYNSFLAIADELIPADGVITSVLFHPITQEVGLLVQSDEWDSCEPLKFSILLKT